MIRLHGVLLVAAILITAVLSGASRTVSGPTVNVNGRVESNAAGLPIITSRYTLVFQGLTNLIGRCWQLRPPTRLVIFT
jgi:hypothetical protein